MRTALQATVLSLFMVLAGAFYVFSEPFAPKVEVPSGKDANPFALFAAQELNKFTVPDRSEVGVPPYPGARVRYFFKKQKFPNKKKCLPKIKLLPTDEPEKVAEFYRKKLRGYHYTTFTTSHLFYKGKKRLYAEALADCALPYIFIDANTIDPLMPSAKTVIEIQYIPKK